VFATLIIGLTAAIVQYMKETRVKPDTHVMMTYDGKSPAIYSSGYDVTDITSETSPEEIAKVDRINFVLGTGKNTTTFSLKPTGFSIQTCDHDCASTHTLHMYTSEALIVYHGNDAFVANPSENLKLALTHHDVPSLQASPRLKLFFWATVYKLVKRWVWKQVKDAAGRWVWQQVQEQYYQQQQQWK